MIEKLNGYKTLIFFGVALLVKLAGLIGFGDYQASGSEKDVLDFITANQAWILIVGGIAFRFLTTSPVFNKPQG